MTITTLEWWMPFWSHIFQYDPTYHEIFRREIIQSCAKVYQLSPYSYYIIPWGLYEKLDDSYMIFRITFRKPIHIINYQFDWNHLIPLAIGIQYFSTKQSWCDTRQDIILSYTLLPIRVTYHDLMKIYNFDFRTLAS